MEQATARLDLACLADRQVLGPACLHCCQRVVAPIRRPNLDQPRRRAAQQLPRGVVNGHVVLGGLLLLLLEPVLEPVAIVALQPVAVLEHLVPIVGQQVLLAILGSGKDRPVVAAAVGEHLVVVESPHRIQPAEVQPHAAAGDLGRHVGHQGPGVLERQAVRWRVHSDLRRRGEGRQSGEREKQTAEFSCAHDGTPMTERLATLGRQSLRVRREEVKYLVRGYGRRRR